MTIPTRPVSALPTGTSLSRYIIAKSQGLAGGLALAEDMRDTPQIRDCLIREVEWLAKAGTDPMTTSDVGAAAPLAQAGVSQELLALLRGRDAYEQMKPRMRRIPAHIAIPRETGAGTGGGWVGETSPMPIVGDAFTTITQGLFKLGTATVLSKELLQVSPVNEALIRNTMVAGLANLTTGQFLDPSITAVANLRPASITAGATAVTSTGGTPAQIAADLASLIQAVTTPQTMATWIMQPRTAHTIAARMLTVGSVLDPSRGFLGIPVILSEGSPRQITLVDGDGLVYSDAGDVAIDVTDRATVEMSTVATSPVTASTVLVSCWHTNTIAVKCLRWLAWQRAVPGSVAYMTVSY